MANESHVDLAYTALDAYAFKAWGSSLSELDDDDKERVVADLLADLRHLCEANGYDWHVASARCDLHYFNES